LEHVLQMAEDGDIQGESILNVRAAGSKHVGMTLKKILASPAGVLVKGLRVRDSKNQVPQSLADDVTAALGQLDSLMLAARTLASNTENWVVANIATKINELRSSLSVVEEAVNGIEPLCVRIKAFYVDERNAKSLAKRESLKLANQATAVFTATGCDPHLVKWLFAQGLCVQITASNAAVIHAKGTIVSSQVPPSLEMLDKVMVWDRSGHCLHVCMMCVCGCVGISLGFRWYTLAYRSSSVRLELVGRWFTVRPPLLYSYSTAGLPLVYPLSTYGLPLVYHWSTIGLPFVYRWSIAVLPLVYQR
jgi:hypothetical protein